MGDRERGLVLQVAGGSQQPDDFVGSEHDRQNTRHVHRILAIRSASLRVTSKKNFSPLIAALSEVGESRQIASALNIGSRTRRFSPFEQRPQGYRAATVSEDRPTPDAGRGAICSFPLT